MSDSVKSFAGISLAKSRIMGIVNVTPDSFSDGGETFAHKDAIRRGMAMRDQGADILDVGGESTRPGADPVSVDEEIRRVVPVIEALSQSGAKVSIDSRRSEVMVEAVRAGAQIVNDVTALTGSADSVSSVAELDVPVILMHMQGEPGNMQDDPTYSNVTSEILDYLQNRIEVCLNAGIKQHNIAIDPGIGFGKTVAHNLQILNQIDLFHRLECPLVIGVSRKRFIGTLTDTAEPQQRTPGSIAAALYTRLKGAQIFRVHDVAETKQALEIIDQIEATNGEEFVK